MSDTPERYDGKTKTDDVKRALKIIIPIAAVIAAGIVLTVIFLPRSGDFDLGVVFVDNSAYTSFDIADEFNTAAIVAAVKSAAGDVDGDGAVDVVTAYLDCSDEVRPELEENYFKSLNVFAEDQYVLYFCCPVMYEVYTQLNFFDYAVPVDGAALFADERFEGWYACIINWAGVGRGSAKQTEAAHRVIDALLAG